ncbi:MAG TPA: NfeD family protein [Thermoguttaceae bacterium]|nr:NfeD family protein [Thermoguttaceae bacterium]
MPIEPWVWSVLLLVLGMGLAVLEVFFPSAGILGFLSACSILAAIVLGFREGNSIIGFVVLTVAIVGMPTVVVLAFKFWPKTAMGRRVLLNAPTSEDVMPEDPQMTLLKTLVGQIGQTKCKMLPAGAIVIEGRTVDAISEGMPIDAGKPVRVLQVRANRVVVRPLDEDAPSPSAKDPLRRPIDSIAPDPFDESPS